ncbi:MAG: alpha/beta hydrolase [Myxococcota bacterium]
MNQRVGAATVAHHNPDADVVFVFGHPATSYLDHFLVEGLTASGVGVLNIDNRYVGDAIDLSMNTAVADVAEGVRTCASRAKRIVLVGHSGGGPLMTMAQVQFGLGHAIVLLAAHPSRGHIFRDWIDPAVRSDGSRDPALDLFARTPPFQPEFVAAYRAAQDRRVRQLASQAADAMAKGAPSSIIAFSNLCADPRFVDPALDANDRDPEAFPFGEPAEVNARPNFFGGRSTARAFFEQWFVPTTPADGLRLAPYLRRPVLNIGFSADHLVFPSQFAQWRAALPDHADSEWLVGARHNPRGQPVITERLVERLLNFAAKA